MDTMCGSFQNPKKRFLNRWKEQSSCTRLVSSNHKPIFPATTATIERGSIFTPELMGFVNDWFLINDMEIRPNFGFADSQNVTKATEPCNTSLPSQDVYVDIQSTTVTSEHTFNFDQGCYSTVIPQNCHQPKPALTVDANIVRASSTPEPDMRGAIKRWFLPDDINVHSVRVCDTPCSNISTFDQETIIMSPYPSQKRQKLGTEYEQPKSGKGRTRPISCRTCEFCQKIFTTAASTRRHQRDSCKLTKKRSYECVVCGKAMSRLDNLLRHQLTIHNYKTNKG